MPLNKETKPNQFSESCHLKWRWLFLVKNTRNSVLFAFTSRPVPPATSVIVSVGYRLLLVFFNAKPFSFIRSSDVCST